MEVKDRLNLIFKNMKQKEVAEKLQISQSAISDLMHGKKDPSLETLQKICREFNVDGSWLLIGIEGNFLTDEERKIIKGYSLCSDREKGRIDEIIDNSEGNKKAYDKAGNL